jgi:hypothetical protein
MDFASLDTADLANEGALLELRNAVGAVILKPDGNPVTIRLLGSDSDAFIRASNSITNKALRNRGKGAAVTAESVLEDHIALLAKATLGWDGVGIGEDETPFSQEAAKKLYRIAFVREQVTDFIADRGNFTKRSPTT